MIGLYLHVPYCAVRCTYCDFYLVAGRRDDFAAYVDALCAEIVSVPEALSRTRVDSIHFGGGTPSLLPLKSIERLVSTIRETFPLDPAPEIGFEANPEDVTLGSLRGLVGVGVNRLSLGVQSLEDPVLEALGRIHSSVRGIDAVGAARCAGIRSVGVDLILGVPGQSADRSLCGIERVVDAGVEHVSLYILEVHSKTRLGRQVSLGRVKPLGDDAVSTLYETASDLLVGRGFEHYEISNFARPGHRSRHNLKYWTDQEYLGFGPSAHSYSGGRRFWNPPDLKSYLRKPGWGVSRVEDIRTGEARGVEALCAGLRVTEGVDLELLRRRYGSVIPSPADPIVSDLEVVGLVEVQGERLRLTRRGRLLSNEVFERLLPDPAPGQRTSQLI